VQYCVYFGERKYFENTQWQPYDKSYCYAKLPLHRKNSSKTNLIAFPCYNHVTTAGTLIALSEQNEQLDTTDNLRIELNDADASTRFRPNPGGKVPNHFFLALSFSPNYPAKIQAHGVASFRRFLNMGFAPEISLKRLV
jgi:hypothetical protein